MKEQEIKIIELKDIRIEFYVRQAPSEERILYFGEMYEGGVALPPLQVAPTKDGKWSLVDGRHRKEALELLGRTTADAIIVPGKDRLELTMAALGANLGGAKEMTMADIRATIIGLLEQGYSRTRIRQLMPFPKEMTRKLMKDAQSRWLQARLVAATSAVEKSNVSIKDAAKQYKVEEDQIETHIHRKQRMEEKETGTSFAQVKSSITQRYYNQTKVNGLLFRKIIQRYSEGELTAAQVEAIVAHAQHEERVHGGNLKDWHDRIAVLLRTNAPMHVEVPTPVRRKGGEVLQ